MYHSLCDTPDTSVSPSGTTHWNRTPVAKKSSRTSPLDFARNSCTFFMTYGEFGNASNYGMILMSLVVMYCVIFNYYSSKLISTQSELNTAANI